MATPSAYPPLPPSPYGRLMRDGHPWVWITRITTAVLLLMVAGIVGIVVVNGLSTFWPRRLVRYEHHDGTVVVGEEIQRQIRHVGQDSTPEEQILVRVGNREIHGSGADFRWIRADDVKATSTPADLVSFERYEHGPAYGRVAQLIEVEVVDRRRKHTVVAEGEQARSAIAAAVEAAADRREARLKIQEGTLDKAAKAQNEHNNVMRKFSVDADPNAPDYADRLARLEARKAVLDAAYEKEAARAAEIITEDRKHLVLLEQGDGTPFPKPMLLSQILRIEKVNDAGFFGRIGMAIGRFWRFVTERPREANTDGGIWPAIFGTVLMTLLMTIIVVPFGVLAALYLREYAKQGAMISAVRIAVNNLAGVPSIVFGIFGLGFFCYFVGGWIDHSFYEDRLPTPTFGGGGILWASLTLALLTVPVVIVATEEALAAVPRSLREAAIACGASKWQAIRRVVLPHASPGILTGMILAMARGAGEVAPLMLTGVIKLAKDLPLDGEPPFLHPERRFMHLGFHIYDTGFQSPNVDASTPLVYSTTLVLLILVLLLNLGAILLRNRLRKRMRTGVF